MSLHWTEYLRAIGPTLIAVFVAYIAYGQWRLAQATLREKLFDRRMEVFEATHALLSEVMRDSMPSDDAINAFTPHAQRAHFLFGKEFQDFLWELRRKALKKQYFHKVWDLPENASKRSDFIQKDSELFAEMQSELNDLWKNFEPYLGFEKIR